MNAQPRISALLASALLLLAMQGAEAKTSPLRTATIAVPTMQCGMCEERIEAAVRKLRGVSSAEADAEKKRVTVRYEGRTTTRREIEKAIAAAGYDAGGQRATTATKEALPACCRAK